VKISVTEILMLLVLITLVIVPTGPTGPNVEPVEPVAPDPIVATGDILDQAEDTLRDSLVRLLEVYKNEDLTDSKYFDQFSEELSREQETAMLPVAKAICESDDLMSTSRAIADHKLGVK